MKKTISGYTIKRNGLLTKEFILITDTPPKRSKPRKNYGKNILKV
jgi:hypothetical protein